MGTCVLSGSPLQWRQGKGQEDAEALLPKLPPLVGAAQPATLLHVAGRGSRPVQLVTPTALGRVQGRRASCPAKKLITLKANTSSPQTPGRFRSARRSRGTHPHLCAPGPDVYSAHAPPLPKLLRPANARPLFAHRFQSIKRQQAKESALRFWPSWQLKESAQSPALYPRTDLTQVL